MKFLVALAALVAVACAAPGAIISPYGAPLATGSIVRGAAATIAGPSGTIIADTGAIASPLGASIIGAPALSRTIVAPGVIGAPLGLASPVLSRSILAPGLVNPGLVNPGLVAPGLLAPGIIGGGLIY